MLDLGLLPMWANNKILCKAAPWKKIGYKNHKITNLNGPSKQLFPWGKELSD